MKCPKCNTLLFRDKDARKQPSYECIGCGLYGTVEEMEKQLSKINRIYDETLYKVTCKICGQKISTSEAKIVKIGFSHGYVCRKHNN